MGGASPVSLAIGERDQGTEYGKNALRDAEVYIYGGSEQRAPFGLANGSPTNSRIKPR